MRVDTTYLILSRSIYDQKIRYTTIKTFKTRQSANLYIKKLNDPKYIVAKKIIYYYD